MPAVLGFLAEQPIDGDGFELDTEGEAESGGGVAEWEGEVAAAGLAPASVTESAESAETAEPAQSTALLAPAPTEPAMPAAPSPSPAPSAQPAKPVPCDGLRLGPFGTNEVNLPAQTGRGRDFARGREARDVPVDSGSGGCADPEGR
jgi:hypothetical protein